MSNGERSLLPILTVNFVGTLGFGIVLPFLVFLVTRLGGNALIYGIMGATYSFFQLIGAPILGRWSDRFGRKRVLLVSQLGTLVSWGIFLVALALPTHAMFAVDSEVLGAFTVTVPLAVLFFARALDGVTGGNISVANAYLADITEGKDRSASFGKMAISTNLGYVLGPALAGVLGATAMGETLPVLAAFAISAVASLLIAFGLRESRVCVLAADPEQLNVGQVLGQDQKQCFQMTAAPSLSMSEVLKLPSVALLCALQFLVFLAFNFFYIGFPVYAATGIGWSLTETGVFFAVMGILMIGVQGPVLSRAAAVLSDRALIVCGGVVLAVSFVLFTSRATLVIYAGAALLALGNGLMWPSLVAVLSKTTPPRYQGTVQGFAGSAAAVASIAGLLAGGLLYGWLEARVFVLSALVTAVTAALALRISPPALRPG